MRLGRTHFLSVGVMAYSIGLALSVRLGVFSDATDAIVGLFAILLAQLMTHFVNEFYDYESDMRSRNSMFAGGSGVLVEGTLSRRLALSLSYFCLVLGFALASFLLLGGRAAFFLIYAVVLFLGWFYSSPPLRLVSSGLGETTASLVVAFVSPLAAISSQPSLVPFPSLLSLIPLVVSMQAAMLGVEAPDCDSDGTTGKRTLVVRLGIRKASSIYISLCVLAVASQATATFFGLLGLPGLLVSLATLPSAHYAYAAMRSSERTVKERANRLGAASALTFGAFGVSTLLGLLF